MKTQARERPILMSPPMVRAILDGRKTQTRRAIKDQPAGFWKGAYWEEDGDYPGEGSWWLRAEEESISSNDGLLGQCPYGLPGDQLYISERIEWLDIKSDGTYGDLKYLVDGRIDVVQIPPRVKCPRAGRWPGRTLPIEWARPDRLEIKEVRVERVQEISEEDARAEGIKAPLVTQDHLMVEDPAFCWEEAFADLWNSINQKRGGGWDVNPWVWIISFKRVNNEP